MRCFLINSLISVKTNKQMFDKRREYIAKEITDAEQAKAEAIAYPENANKNML